MKPNNIESNYDQTSFLTAYKERSLNFAQNQSIEKQNKTSLKKKKKKRLNNFEHTKSKSAGKSSLTNS